MPAAFSPSDPARLPTTPSVRGASKNIRVLADDDFTPLDEARASVTDEALSPKTPPINDFPHARHAGSYRSATE